ncbi:hypothetical protein GGR56DRAFT_664468 [Xylariaceae sp. FL0804]|nr:hypothetical protein GGR56DRAFT_664468 [Xylariaceae sp. FL0804]
MASARPRPSANPASNNSAAAAAAPSYASAAGAGKKQTAPLVATGTNPPIVATGSSAPNSQHAKSSSVSPMNGRPNIMPAVPNPTANAPAVVHGTSNVNGDHSRKTSVQMSSSGPPNNYSANGGQGNVAKPGIQFGFQDSPAASHSTPQTGSASVPIPGSTGNPRVTSPANSPSPIPIPQSSVSGGRPPSSTAQQGGMTFGSFGADSDRPHMRTPSATQDPSALGPQHSPHIRRGSNVSDVSNHAGPPPGGMQRGGYSGSNRGRGGYNHYNNQPMGYPPNNYNRGPQGNQGRGGMAPNFGNGRPHQFGGQQPPNRSPAMGQAMPQGQQPMPVPTPYYYAPPNMGPTQVPPQVYSPPFHFSQDHVPFKGKKRGQRRGSEKFSNPRRRWGDAGSDRDFGQRARRFSTRLDQRNVNGDELWHSGQHPFDKMDAPFPADLPTMAAPPPYPSHPHFQSDLSHLDLSPESGNFDRELTKVKQNYPYGAHYDPSMNNMRPGMAPPMQGYAMYPMMHPQAQSPGPHFQQPYNPGPYQPPGGQPMSRGNSSQIGETRPASSASQTQAPVAHGTPQPQAAKPVFADGRPVDLKALKSPSPPAPTEQQSKTPPVASTPKPAAPAHARADSSSNGKSAEEAASGEKPKDEELSKPADESKPAEENKAAEAEEPKPIEEPKPAEEPKPVEQSKPLAEEKTVHEASAKADTEGKAADTAVTKSEAPKRIIREMEEEDARREKEQEEQTAQSRKANAAENDRKLREQEAEMEQQAKTSESTSQGDSQADGKGAASATAEVTKQVANLNLNDKTSAAPSAKPSPGGRTKPAALNLAPLNTKSVEPPQPNVIKTDIYPPGIHSPNPALNSAVARKGTSFKYDPTFLLQFKPVFTEQPSLDFHQQVKNLIGDGDGGRTGAPSFPKMGDFGARTLEPGTTSQQRFEMSTMGSRGIFPRPPGVFPGGSQMSRTPSTSNMGSMPHSPRTNTEAQAAKTMPLTAGMKIESLSTSQTGWKPTSLGKPQSSNLSGNVLMDPAMVQRKVKAALNKMTPEKFDRIADQILEIAAQSKDETDGRTLRQVIQLTFEKATDEAHWASMYARFCKRMLETMSPEVRDENIKDKNGQVVSGGALFRKYLLNRCQEEFERGWKTDLEEGGETKPGEAVMLSDEYYKAAAAKRRGLGLVQFIGELYKLGMLTERIMHECVRKLVDYSGVPDEAEVESLTKLLRTIGANLDADKGRAMMNAYFERIESMVALPELPSRLQFMLMDIIDLRRANWHSKEGNKGPKTLEEIRAEAEAQAARKAAENAQRGPRGGGGRMQTGRGDARNFSGGGFPQPVPNQVGMDDLRRLKGGASQRSSASLTFGPSSMLNSRSNSGRRLGGPGGSLSHRGDESGNSSRTGTPPVKEAPTSTNSFGLLANMDSDHPGSPPSTAASPALAKATPETAAAGEKE